jgi:hypothetical protein
MNNVEKFKKIRKIVLMLNITMAIVFIAIIIMVIYK